MHKTKEVSKLTGLSVRQLQYWDEHGYVVPKIERHRRLYDDRQLRGLMVIAALKRRGVSRNDVLAQVNEGFWRFIGYIQLEAGGWLLWDHYGGAEPLRWCPTEKLLADVAAKAEGPVTIVEFKAA
jgi:hypothetical protein